MDSSLNAWIKEWIRWGRINICNINEWMDGEWMDGEWMDGEWMDGEWMDGE